MNISFCTTGSQKGSGNKITGSFWKWGGEREMGLKTEEWAESLCRNRYRVPTAICWMCFPNPKGTLAIPSLGKLTADLYIETQLKG